MTTRLTITLCGSLTRAGRDLTRVHRALALAGHLVHAPTPPLPGEPTPTPEQYANLVLRHHAAIRRSDLVIAICPDGEPGDATRSEMAYAQLVGRHTRWAYDIDALLVDIAAGRLDQTEVPA
ncbi:hypothetical protein GCM10027280_45570 [Micromonospora polyrhachis]|uniref:Nucleoside 2-deoxyribosyltransferase n=1 Tax=Micromonospora polyrhachis TaxID=1282883 RepID=A0A7W7SQ80_9ACTN|nr:hypothetical protein [Micromonospora polyrhachis]MBB4958930.1 hypothetical protein [Micromonospora polyrhachis]